jgi:hypothetical protein
MVMFEFWALRKSEAQPTAGRCVIGKVLHGTVRLGQCSATKTRAP